MKFDIIVGGAHKAQITVDLNGKGGFTGNIVSPEFGTGLIRDGLQVGTVLTGTVTLDGYDADFTATLDANDITGKLRMGWFFSQAFTGTQAT